MSRVDDIALLNRANAYAARVEQEAGAVRGATLTVDDVARAFVIGFAAGAEAQANHRTVRK